MKFTSAICLTVLALLFFSCQKDFSPVDGEVIDKPSFSNKIKTYTEDITIDTIHSAITFTLNYDASERIISMISSISPDDKFVFQYNGKVSYTMDIFSSTSSTLHEEFFLNSLMLVDSTIQNNDGDTSTEKFIYNATKQMITAYEYDYTTAGGSVLTNTHHYTYDSKGDQVSDIDDYSTTAYTYDTIAYNFASLPYQVVGPIHLIKTHTVTSGGESQMVNHTYTFDSYKRIVSEKLEIPGLPFVIIRRYTYY